MFENLAIDLHNSDIVDIGIIKKHAFTVKKNPKHYNRNIHVPIA